MNPSLPLMVRASFLLPSILFFLAFSIPDFAAAQDRSRANTNRAFEKYVDGLLQTYDGDHDGKLNQAEVGQMRRKPTNADENEDGEISRAELLSFFTKRSGKSDNDSNTTNSTGSEPRKATDRAKNKSQRTVRNSIVVDAVIVRLSDQISVSKVVDELRGQDFTESRDTLQNLATKTADATFDSLQFSAIVGSKCKINVGRQAPTISGATLTRGGNVSRSISTYEVGTKIEVLAIREKNNFNLEVDLAKSIVKLSDVVLSKTEDETIYAQDFLTLEFDSTLECEPGKTAVFTSTDSGNRWIVAFSAK